MKLTKQRIKEIIKEELESMNEEPIDEGIENITPENIEIVMQGLKKLIMSPYTGPMIAAAFAAIGIEGIREKLSGSGGSDDVK